MGFDCLIGTAIFQIGGICSITMTLQVVVSITYFAQKIFILYGKKSGWLVGVVAALLAIVYYQRIGLHIYVVLNIGMSVLMAYGFFKKADKKPMVELAIRLVTLVVMGYMTFHVFRGTMTIVELISSAVLLFGTYLLTHDYMKSGWGLFFVGHAFAVPLGYEKMQYIFMWFQVASAIASVVGMMQKPKKPIP